MPNVTREPFDFVNMQYRPINVENVPVFNPTQNVVDGNDGPRSNSAFVLPRPVTPSSEEHLPWSGSTPPSRDMGMRTPIKNRLVAMVFCQSRYQNV